MKAYGYEYDLPYIRFISSSQLHFPGKRQALLNVVPGEYTDDDITPISFYPLLRTLDW